MEEGQLLKFGGVRDGPGFDGQLAGGRRKNRVEIPLFSLSGLFCAFWVELLPDGEGNGCTIIRGILLGV